MTSLYLSAVERAGGENRLCQECKPLVASYATSLGLKIRDNRPSLARLLAEIIVQTNNCWHCGWLISIFSDTWPEKALEIFNSPELYLTKVYLGWHTIDNDPVNQRSPEDIPQANQLRFSYTTDPSEPNQPQILFSSSTEEPTHLSSLLSEAQTLEWPDLEPYSGRIRSSRLDHRLVKRWKETCLKEHGGTCDQTFMTHRIESLRFVDVVDRCIVVRPSNGVSWVALSYCWGGPQIHSLQKGNLQRYLQAGSLTDDILPRGIIDAIAATLESGERYLWVDSLCIIQDDEKDKLALVNAMDTVYAHATMTLINAANDRVALGIPGISVSRKAQKTHKMKDFWFVEALDSPHRPYEGYLRDSTWNSRGWTFQEGLLSSRCLIFGNEQVYWQCKTSAWCEDSFRETEPDLHIYRHYAGTNILKSLTDSREDDWIKIYNDVLNNYSSRVLTSESDRLSALQGVLGVLRRPDEESYFWGMPTGHMEMALTWASNANTTRRACDCTFIDTTGRVVTCPFPSWSWLGWYGYTPMPTINRALLGGRLGLKFYSITEDGEPVALNENPFAGPERDFSDKPYLASSEQFEMIGYPRGLTHDSILGTQKDVSKADIPPPIASSSLIRSLLCFWTSTAELEMQYEGWNGFHNCPLIKLRGASGGGPEFYGAWERNKSFQPTGIGKFIVVGTERTRMSHGGNVTVNLLLVEQGNDGVSYRQKLVTYVPESTWEKVENRAWELVFLA